IPASSLPAIIRTFAPYLYKGILHTPKIEATSHWRARTRALSVMAHFPIEEPEDSGSAVVRSVLRSIQHGKLNWAAIAHLPQNIGEVANLTWTAKVRHRRAISRRAHIRLNLDCEQYPSPDNRITLSNHTDELGMPIPQLHWRIGERERHTITTYSNTIDTLFQTMKIELPYWRPELKEENDTWLNYAGDTFHMMGGTRMGTSSANSVVDRNLRVHGIDNLWVAGCSVFPTGGSSNPTFTMMALTLRLADTLKNYLHTK
ncbi:MAG TPA: GMC family oxidoreductase, partial [Edaphobacter sp.]|nr:GMC family oxidoreductase [Edaphobacter sp.]